MKILIYTHEFPPYHGGAGIYAYELANGLQKLGQDVCVLTTVNNIKDSTIDKNAEFKVIHRSFGKKSIRRNFLFFALTLLKERPDITMVVECAAQMQAARFRRILPYPYIITVHGSEIWSYFDSQKGYFNLHPKEAKRLKQFFLGAHQLISVCNSTKELILEYLPELAVKTTVVHNGISPELFPIMEKATIEEYRSALGLQNKKVLLCVSRLARSKGYEILFRAFKKVLKFLPETMLLIIGNGPEKDNLETLAKELDCSKKICFLGEIPRKKLYIYYNISDLFILTSQQEAFPFVCLEANACGKAVIAGHIGGIPELVTDNVNGMLVTPDNPDEIADQIVNLLENNTTCNIMGKNARKLVLDEFTSYNMAKKTLKIIQNLMEG